MSFLIYKTVEKLPFSDDLTRHVIDFSGAEQVKSSPGGSLSIRFLDDAKNVAFKAAQRLLEQDSFKLQVDMISGNDEVIRSMFMDHCIVNEISHSSSEYASNSSMTFVLNLKWDFIRFEYA